MASTSSQFLKDLTEFVASIDACSKEKWTLHKAHDGFWAKQSVMAKWRSESVNRQAHIIYNKTYNVPVLWFNIYHRDGRPLQLDQILEFSNSNNNTFGADLAKNISPAEHPYCGVLFYNIHPCNTMKIMEEMKGEGNYIVRWLSVYGTPIGIRLPLELLGEQLQQLTINGHSNGDGHSNGKEQKDKSEEASDDVRPRPLKENSDDVSSSVSVDLTHSDTSSARDEENGESEEK